MYPKNHENFDKNSKSRVQFYWFLLKKCIKFRTNLAELYGLIDLDHNSKVVHRGFKSFQKQHKFWLFLLIFK